MALALPSPWVDTGISRSVTVKGSARIKLYAERGGIAKAVFGYQIPSIWELQDASFDTASAELLCPSPSTQRTGATKLNLVSTALGTFTLENVAHTCATMPVTRWSSVYSYEETTGPFRLGVKYELIGASANPQFPRDYQMVYHWFADEDTLLVASCAGHSLTYYFKNAALWTTTPNPGITPVDRDTEIGRLTFGATLEDPVSRIDFTGLGINDHYADALIPTDELNDGLLVGNGDGAVNAARDTVSTSSQSVYAPKRVYYNLDVTKNKTQGTLALTDSTLAQVEDTFLVPVQLHSDLSEKTPQQPYVPMPWGTEYDPAGDAAEMVIWNVSWEWHKKSAPSYWGFNLRASWANSPPDGHGAYPSEDRIPCLAAVPALSAPGPAPGGSYDPETYVHPSYLPITVAAFTSALSVHRPDGNRPTDWVTQNANGTVTESAPSTTLHQISAGAVFRRTFGAIGTDLPEWRPWLGVGASGKADAAFNPDQSEHTKHTAGSDVWAWHSYGRQRWNVTAPSAETLTLTIRGVQEEVSDSHVTGSQRNTDYVCTEHPFTVTYPIVLAAGANVVDVDLLRPASGSTLPFYYGRVDELELSGFANGDTVITGFSLLAGTGPYEKFDIGAPEQRRDYSVYGYASGGSHGGGGLPDLLYKEDETRTPPGYPPYGGNLRAFVILTGADTGTILDTQMTLADFVARLDLIEGWSWTYSSAAFDAANRDPYGSAPGPELAHNLQPLVPYQQGSLKCWWHCSRMVITNAQRYVLWMRWPLGHGSLHGLVLDTDGNRCPEGTLIRVVRPDTGQVACTAECDSDGLYFCSPVPGRGPDNGTEWLAEVAS